MFERVDKNSDGKLTKDEIPEDRPGMRIVFERVGSDSVSKEQFVREMMAMAQRPGFERGARPDGAPPRPGEGPGRRGGGPMGGGLFAALDTDRDGQLSNEEIVGAGTALLKLDRNRDGRVSPEEAFGPPGPPRDRGPGDRGPGERGPGDRGPGDRGPGERPDRGPGDRPSDRPSERGRDGDRPAERRPGDRPEFGRGNFSPEAFYERLKAADTDKDGKLSKDEAPPMLKDRFDQADSNSDGFIDETEMRQITSRMGRGRGPGPRDNQ
jgi:Ca2+-binding EF-hand superfamily protein